VAASGRDANGQVRRWRVKFLVDASGRDTLLASRFDIKQRNPKHASAAIFGHFTGVRRLPGRDEGNISLFWFDHGRFWFIPLADGTTSVGAVCRPTYLKSRQTDLSSFFMATIAHEQRFPWCRCRERLLARAEKIGARLEDL
jgi:flavin-dependent dehydrogenase